MLEELVIRDYALIDRLSISFKEGLSILSGETGAGKSIIVGALGFLLGAKADSDSVREGCDEAVISAIIRYNDKNKDVTDWLDAHSISSEDQTLILRRTLKKTGRSSIYLQDSIISRSDLLEISSCLFDIHGQHEHQALLRKETHRKYLDRFAGIEEEALAFNACFQNLAELRKSMEQSIENEKSRADRIELLQYAIEEINKAKPKPGESSELEAESTRLGAHEKLADQINTACSILLENDFSCISMLRKACNALEAACTIDRDLELLTSRLNDVYYELEDSSEQVRKYRDELQFDPDRLEAVEERLAVLYRLKKKYGEDEDAVIQYKNDAESELEALSRSEEDRALLKKRILDLEKEIASRAAALSEKRLLAAKALSEKISVILRTLGMPKAEFTVSVSTKGQASSGRLLCGPWGADDVEFLISANLGEPLKELSKIASGGELSRVMLAVKTILAGSDTVETIVFDEIDSGIGGEVAIAVAKHLSMIAENKQIFCITHLASIAVRADNHMKVEKRIEGNRTLTGLRVLSRDQQREEIARMLAGDSAADAALAHADELLKKYGKRG